MVGFPSVFPCILEYHVKKWWCKHQNSHSHTARFWPNLTLISIGQVVRCQVVMAHCLYGYLPKKRSLSAQSLSGNTQVCLTLRWKPGLYQRILIYCSEIWMKRQRQATRGSWPASPPNTFLDRPSSSTLPTPVQQVAEVKLTSLSLSLTWFSYSLRSSHQTKHIVVGMDPIVRLLTLIW